MVKCQWSVEGICRCFSIKEQRDGVWYRVNPACDGEHKVPCSQSALDLEQVHIPLEDVEDQGPKKNPGRGGKRPGAGAPRGNLNALKDGVYSRQLRRLHQEEKRILRTAREKRAKRSGHPATS